MGNFQSVEVGEELTVSSSQSKDCDLSCSVQLMDVFSSIPMSRHCRHSVLMLFLRMVYQFQVTGMTRSRTAGSDLRSPALEADALILNSQMVRAEQECKRCADLVRSPHSGSAHEGKARQMARSALFVCLLVGCLTSQQQASVSQGRICSDRLFGLVAKASASRAEDPGFESRLRRDFFGVEPYQ